MPSTLQLRTTTTTTTTTTTFATDISSSVTKTMAAEMMPSLAEELTRELSRSCPSPDRQMEIIARHHNHEVMPNQCCSAVVRRIAAPMQNVWELVRRFDEPQTYKHFLRSCRLITGDAGQVGSLREVHCVSGVPAASSTERLEVLDEESRAIGFRVISGEHRLQNYRSVTTVHPSYPLARASLPGAVEEGDNNMEEGTVVVESYVVDVPEGNTKQETCVFVDTIVRCNLQSLANLAERMGSTTSSSSSAVTSSTSCKVS
ncbi:abscisic acid receptor PYL4-like [Silene latifolia]|uniref:abscisic acid receptor PYL4-like n=1 Tax=Silene latifolia TaxID=37657 RepID=UPI003D77BFA4